MYAVVRFKGYQYLVKPGDRIIVPAKVGNEGKEILFDQVLLYQNDDEIHVGRPTLDDVQVKGKIIRSGKMDKVMVFKYKRKKNYRRLRGHRQEYSEIQVSEIVAD